MNITRSALVVASFAAILVACSGDDDGSPAQAPAATAQSQPAAAAAPSATTDAPVAAGPDDAPWNPKNDIAGLSLWLNGDTLVEGSAAGMGHVASWTDQSGAKNDAAPAPNVSAPKIVITGPNRGASFDGTQALIVKDNASLQFASGFTIAVVARSKQTKGTYGALFGKSEFGAPYTGPAFFVNYPAGANGNQGAIGGQLDFYHAITSGNLALDDDQTRLYILERSGDTLRVRVNNDAWSKVDVSTLGDTSAVGVDAFIGGHPGASAQGFEGAIYELIATPAELQDEDCANLYVYAKNRYGIVEDAAMAAL